MSTIYLYSDAFADTDFKDLFVVRPSHDIWERWQQEHFGATRLFLRIQNPATEEDFYCSVGDPIHSNTQNAVYMPMWMIDTNQYTGCGDEATGTILTPEDIPRATRIVLKPIDSTIHEVDVVRCLERPLSSIGVLQQGKMYLIPLEELGDFQVAVFVEQLEPAEVVFLDGDEIPLEFVEAVDYYEPPAPAQVAPRPPTPIPAEIPTLLPFGNMISNEETAPAPTGRAFHSRTTRNHCPPGFVAFAGKGNRLDR
jgi:hypothetical protein